MNEIDKRRNELIDRESGKAGLRGKINAKWIENALDTFGGGGNWRQQVEACTSYFCPLYPVRPTSKPRQE